MNNPTETKKDDQYSLTKILVIKLLAAVPMGILGWIAAPAFAADFTEDPIGTAVARVGILTISLNCFSHAVFKTILGEELLFRAVLLPKMERVRGRWAFNDFYPTDDDVWSFAGGFQ